MYKYSLSASDEYDNLYHYNIFSEIPLDPFYLVNLSFPDPVANIPVKVFEVTSDI